jgi:type 1 glutamine amidotransferase
MKPVLQGCRRAPILIEFVFSFCFALIYNQLSFNESLTPMKGGAPSVANRVRFRVEREVRRIRQGLRGLGTSVVSADASPQPVAPAKVLYLTHSAGFKHPVLPHSEQVFKEIGSRTGAYEATVTQDCSLISKSGLQPYKAVVFYTTGELPITDGQKAAFLDFIKSGNGFVGIHSATDTFYKWPEFGDLIGGYFDGHPWHQEIAVKVEDQKHPSTKHLGATFKITDEIYQFKNWSRDRIHVLLSVDVSSIDLTKKGVNRTDKDFALCWTREYGKGRMFYTALGHRPEVWNDPRFQEHLVGGIKWAGKF